MQPPSPAELDYWASPGPLTDPGRRRSLFEPLPHEPRALCEAVQGLVIHRGWAPLYPWTPSDAQAQDAQARDLPAMLDRILAHDPAPLDTPRAHDSRFAGTCRDFAVLLCAILRHQGVPARARCGFGSYFQPGQHEDHWICERWDAGNERWIQTDAQLDPLQQKALSLDFDPLDVPRDRFEVAGQVWQGCADGRIDPERCGIFDMHGLWFVRANVARDLAALNRIELLPWDDWGLVLRLGEEPIRAPADRERIERAAALGREPRLDALRDAYESDPELRVPAEVRNWQTGRDEVVRP